MKRLFLLAALFVFAFGCSDDIESNTPVIQGSVNEEFFRAKDATATINDDGSLKLIGTSSERNITLQTSSFETGQYALGTNPSNEATFTDYGGMLYLAGAGTGDGMIEITKYQAGTVSGEFYFNALNNGVGDTLNFQKGVFFEVPITNANPGDGDPEGDFMTADIGGNAFDAEIIATLAAMGTIEASGSTQTTTISLTFPEDIAAGTYTLSAAGVYTAEYLVNSTAETVDTGELVITSNDTNAKIVEGTFEFTTSPSGTVISDGKFSLGY